MLSLTTLKQLTTSSVQRDVTLRGQLTLINLLSSAQQTVTCRSKCVWRLYDTLQ